MARLVPRIRAFILLITVVFEEGRCFKNRKAGRLSPARVEEFLEECLVDWRGRTVNYTLSSEAHSPASIVTTHRKILPTLLCVLIDQYYPLFVGFVVLTDVDIYVVGRRERVVGGPAVVNVEVTVAVFICGERAMMKELPRI